MGQASESCRLHVECTRAVLQALWPALCGAIANPSRLAVTEQAVTHQNHHAQLVGIPPPSHPTQQRLRTPLQQARRATPRASSKKAGGSSLHGGKGQAPQGPTRPQGESQVPARCRPSWALPSATPASNQPCYCRQTGPSVCAFAQYFCFLRKESPCEGKHALSI